MDALKGPGVRFGPAAMRSYPTVPEGVSHSVSETDEALLVFSHEVACVEVGVALREHISHQLLLSQLLASSIAKERAEGAHLGEQEPRLT